MRARRSHHARDGFCKCSAGYAALTHAATHLTVWSRIEGMVSYAACIGGLYERARALVCMALGIAFLSTSPPTASRISTAVPSADGIQSLCCHAGDKRRFARAALCTKPAGLGSDGLSRGCNACGIGIYRARCRRSLIRNRRVRAERRGHEHDTRALSAASLGTDGLAGPPVRASLQTPCEINQRDVTSNSSLDARFPTLLESTSVRPIVDPIGESEGRHAFHVFRPMLA